MKDIEQKLIKANEDYRNGNPTMSDKEYELLLNSLPKNHYLRNRVEPEKLLNNETFKHEIPMLSTQKVKTNYDVLKWIGKVEKAANKVGIDPKLVYITTNAKLDGMAARQYENGTLVTRGDGITGNIITSAFKKGVRKIPESFFGDGELVIRKSYFDSEMTDKYSHPRNAVVGLVMGDKIDPVMQKALNNNEFHFALYEHIYKISVSIEEFRKNYRQIEKNVRENTPYPIDGVVLTVNNKLIQDVMGANNHHKYYQCALKPQDETAITKVFDIKWQVGRTGKITPVLNVEPTELDGCVIENVTGHNAKNIIVNKIRKGTAIEIVRSGSVIPKIERVIESQTKNYLDPVSIPTHCPVCDYILIESKSGTDLICENTYCSGQKLSNFKHFFKTIDNIDEFGEKTLEKILDAGIDTIPEIYELTCDDFENMGFGPKQSFNLETQLYDCSLEDPIEDWKFLAALGIKHLSKGRAKDLLKHYSLETLLYQSILASDLKSIEGFGNVISYQISEEIYDRQEELADIFELDFNIIVPNPVKITTSPISGKNIVFSGSMEKTRSEMEDEAESFGAIAQKTINKKTDFLVTGKNVGQSKISKAKKFNTAIITVDDYFNMIT